MSATTVTAIARDELRRRLDAGEPTVVVEALGPTYYDDAHIPGARNLPHDRVDELADQVIGDRDAFCLLYTSPSPRDLSTSRMPSSA